MGLLAEVANHKGGNVKFEIKHRWNGEVLFSIETKTFRLAVEAAMGARADLCEANLCEANLSGANLSGANLSGANLSGAAGVFWNVAPPSGSFLAWKKGANGSVIKLKIPWYARRVSPIGYRKCRAELAITLSIKDRNGATIKECKNWNDSYTYKYEVGKFQGSPNGYDASRSSDCLPGIHFFMTKQEAMEWN